MDSRKVKLRKIVRRFFNKSSPRARASDLQSRVGQQRLAAESLGVNPFDLPWSGQERELMALAFAKTSPPLPTELKNAIFDFASKPPFLQNYGIDMDTAREIEKLLDQEPVLKAAMKKLPPVVKQLVAGAAEASADLFSINEEISSSRVASEALRNCVETGIAAILGESDPRKQFAQASGFLKRLAAFGIETR